jgi:DNA-binding MarR family transcriptional regulator
MGKQPTVSDLEDHLGYQLRRVSNQVSGSFARALQGEGLSVAEWVALRRLLAFSGMTAGQLAQAAGLTRGAMSKVLEKLESKALIGRSGDPRDSRIQCLALTRKGAGLLPRLAALADANDEHFFGCLDAEEHAALAALLRKLTEFHQLRGVPTD